MEELESFLNNVYGAYAASGVPPFLAGTIHAAPDPFVQPDPEPNPRSRCGRKPFGFYAGEVAVIQQILELRAQGLGFDRLADHLNGESVRSRSGKPWHGRVVNRIVKAELAKR